jgi:hypothetical protein
VLPANRPVEAILEFKDAPPRVMGVNRMALTYQNADFKQASTVYFWDIPFRP